METSGLTEDPGYLRNYLPFLEIDDTSLILIANSAKQVNLKAKEVLFNIGSKDDICYLLKNGTLELEADDGKKRIVEQGSPAAKSPIALLKPRKYKVKALTPCEVIAIKDQVLKVASQGLLVSKTKKYDDIEMQVSWGIEDSTDAQENCSLAEQLITEITNGTLALPSVPKVAMKVHELVDGDASTSEIAHHISMDPTISAKLIAIANSVFYQGAKDCSDLPLAISRIGTQVVKQLVFSFALKDQFNSTDRFLSNLFIEAWQESIEISVRCFALADYLTKSGQRSSLQKEKALLAGLLHNIGCVPIIKFFDNKKRKVSEEGAELILNEYKNMVGSLLLKSWKLSEELTYIPENAGAWFRDHDGEADYLDLVLVSQFIYQSSRLKGIESLPDVHALPAYNKLLKTEPETDLVRLIETAAKNQIDQIRHLLQ